MMKGPPVWRAFRVHGIMRNGVSCQNLKNKVTADMENPPRA